MKTIFTSILLLLFAGIACNVFSQEWKWRDSSFFDLKERVLEQTDYTGFVFNDTADFRKSVFSTKASFISAKFSATHFNGTQFLSKVYFNHAEFDSIVYFDKTIFATNAVFQNTKFHLRAFFSNQVFNSTIDFRLAHFYSEARFDSVHFNETAKFNQAEFDSLAFFLKTQFKSEAYFIHAKFKSKTSFQLAHFDSLAVFKHAKFNGETYFTYATLPRYLDFSKVTTIATEIDFTSSFLDSICNINLTGSAIDKIRFRYNRFKLWFPNDDPINFELKSGIYEDLLKKQKDEGFTQSYETLDKEYQEFKYIDPESGKGWWGHVQNWMEKYWWGYGYDKERIIWNTVIIFLILSFINSFFLKYLITQVYSNEKINKLIEKRDSKNGFIRWFDSLRYSIFYTAVIFFSFNFDMDKLNYAGNLDGWKVLNLTWFMLVYLGGLVCMAYLANYVITI